MGNAGRRYVEHRTVGRRKDDRQLRDHVRKHNQLFQVGQTITSEINMDVLFEVIMDQTNQIMGTERSSVLRYDDRCNELWSLVSTDMKKNEIRIPADYGVSGWVFQNKTPLVINDAYSDPRFYSKIDKKSGFRTRNILCVPLTNRQVECIGTLETLNQ
ncbi:MAG TPA: GAF domain-containing protein [Desulfatiglandales bacterium]|nr:GAF domain-containing protein [Desulfatiglandales bacterium]